MLPLVIGYGAADQAAGFVAKIRQHPELAARVKGYIRVAERRWDLRLENGVTIKLARDAARTRRSPRCCGSTARTGSCRATSPPSTCGSPTASSSS